MLTNSSFYSARHKVFKKGLQIESINDISVKDMDRNAVDGLIRKFSKRLKFRVSRPSSTGDMHYPSSTGDTHGESSFMAPKIKDAPLKDAPLKPSSDAYKQTHSSTSSQESALSPPVMMRSVPASPLLKRLNVMSRSNSKEKDECSARTSIASSNMVHFLYLYLMVYLYIGLQLTIR